MICFHLVPHIKKYMIKKIGPTGMLGLHFFKRKRSVGLLVGLDFQFSAHQLVPLVKTGLQINIFEKVNKSHKDI